MSGITGSERIIVNAPDPIEAGQIVRVADKQGVSDGARRAARGRLVCGRARWPGCLRAEVAYVTPNVDVAPAVPRERGLETAQPADETARGKWWELFGDPDLNALEQQIDVSNQTLQGRRCAVRAGAGAGARHARRPFPTVDIARSASRGEAVRQPPLVDAAPRRQRLRRAGRCVVRSRPVGPHPQRGQREPRGGTGERRRSRNRAAQPARRARDSTTSPCAASTAIGSCSMRRWSRSRKRSS